MAKFSASSIADLLIPAANAGRLARKAKFVVCVEARDGSWCELDADYQGLAGVLARNTVDVLGARGASCWRVDRDGSTIGRAFYTHFESYPEHDAT